MTVSETARAAFRLEVGQISETVSVVAEATLVETANATHGIVIDQQKVVDLPLNGRNFTQLGTLIPGVVAPPSGLGGQTGDATPGGFGNVTGGFNVNGMRNQSNNFLMDGATNNDTFNTGFVLRPPPDAIEEFKILTHAFGAEYGRNAGSVVNVVTKSGSNTLTGSAWEFNRDDALQARNFFAPGNQPKPELKQNQFGAAVGGPIVRNRVFGFGYYEGYRNDAGTTTNVVVLSEAQRAGNFGTTTIRDPLTGLPFANNTIPANRISPEATRLLNDFVPLPNSAGNRYIVSPTINDVRDQFGARIDFQLTQSQSLLLRYMRAETERITPKVIAPVDQRGAGDAAGLHGVAQLRAGLERHQPGARLDQPHHRQPGGDERAQPRATTASTSPTPIRWRPACRRLPSSGLLRRRRGRPRRCRSSRSCRASTTCGRWPTTSPGSPGSHSLKFGVDIRREAMNIAFINRPNGDLTFSGGITGNAAADFLLGLPAQSRATTTQAIQDGYGWLFAGYVQDDFRITPQLTVNLGLRYELPTPFIDVNDAITGFHTGQQSTVFPNAPAGLVYAGDAGVPRGIVPDRQEQLRAAAVGGVGSVRRRPDQRARRRSACSTTRWPGRATSSRAACCRRRSRRWSS